MTAWGSGNALVIGGTGMLAAATRWIIARSARTIVVSRHASHFTAGHSDRTIPVDSSWDDPKFRADLTLVIEQVTRIELALLWLHEPARVLNWLLPMLPNARVVLVLGSMDGRPVVEDYVAPITTVQLGSKATASGLGRRWLTDAEISDAAVAALSDGISKVVGDLRPI